MSPVVVETTLHLVYDGSVVLIDLVGIAHLLFNQLQKADDCCLTDLDVGEADAPLCCREENQLYKDITIKDDRAVKLIILEQVLYERHHVHTELVIFLMVSVSCNYLENELPPVDDSCLRSAHKHIKDESLGSVRSPTFEAVLHLF